MGQLRRRQRQRESWKPGWQPQPLHAPQPPGPWRDRQSDDEQDERPDGSHVVVIDLD